MAVIYKCTECHHEYEKYTTLCDKCFGAPVKKVFTDDKKQNTMNKKDAIKFVNSLKFKFGNQQNIKAKLMDLEDLLKKGLPEENQTSIF